MNARLRNWIIAIFALAAAVSLGSLIFGTGQAPTGPSEPLPTRFVNPRFVGYHQGAQQWRLDADAVEERDEEGPHDEPTRSVHLTHIREGILFQDDAADMRFEARRGVWDSHTGDLELIDDVVFTQEDRLIFRSDHVFWYADDERLVSEVPVHVILDGQVITADRFEAFLAEDRFEFEGNVVWESPDGAVMRADGASYLGDVDTLRFFGRDGPALLQFTGR